MPWDLIDFQILQQVYFERYIGNWSGKLSLLKTDENFEIQIPLLGQLPILIILRLHEIWYGTRLDLMFVLVDSIWCWDKCFARDSFLFHDNVNPVCSKILMQTQQWLTLFFIQNLENIIIALCRGEEDPLINLMAYKIFTKMLGTTAAVAHSITIHSAPGFPEYVIVIII